MDDCHILSHPICHRMHHPLSMDLTKARKRSCSNMDYSQSQAVGMTLNHESHLVGGLEHLLFFHIVGIIILIDYIIFFRGVQTTNQQFLNPIADQSA